MAKRKHRLVIEVTFNRELTDDKAVKGARLLLDHLNHLSKPIWANASDVYVEKIVVKSFNRVLRGFFAGATAYAKKMCGSK